MPEASFSSLPSPKNGGALLLGEPPPPRPPTSGNSLAATERGSWGPLRELKVTQCLAAISPANTGVQGSWPRPPSSPLKAQRPAQCLARGQLSVCVC